MTTAQVPSPASSAAQVLEFTTDLVVHRRHVAADGVVALELQHPQGDDLPAWEPGAHIDLLLEEGLVRQYSLCGDPRDATTWRIGVLLDPRSRGGSRHVHENLEEGSSVRVRGPRNHFPLVDSPRYLFIAGGIGITPIMSMVEAANRVARHEQGFENSVFDQMDLAREHAVFIHLRLPGQVVAFILGDRRVIGDGQGLGEHARAHPVEERILGLVRVVVVVHHLHAVDGLFGAHQIVQKHQPEHLGRGVPLRQHRPAVAGQIPSVAEIGEALAQLLEARRQLVDVRFDNLRFHGSPSAPIIHFTPVFATKKIR